MEKDVILESMHTMYTHLKSEFDSELFKNYVPTERYLLPDYLGTLAMVIGVNFTMWQIPWWHYWTKDYSVFEDKFFRTVLDEDLLNTESWVYLLFDDCFSSKTSYKIKANKLIEFADEYNKSHDFTYLVSQRDHLFYVPDDRKLIIIHHEGLVMEIDFKPEKQTPREDLLLWMRQFDDLDYT